MAFIDHQLRNLSREQSSDTCFRPLSELRILGRNLAVSNRGTLLIRVIRFRFVAVCYFAFRGKLQPCPFRSFCNLLPSAWLRLHHRWENMWLQLVHE